jgi:RNA polymerase sigma-70 factor (ECF subfamily)
MVYSLAARMTGDAGLAEELTQDVFLELDRNRGRMQGEEHIRRWLRQVAMHRAVDAMRRRDHREPGWDQNRWVSLDAWQETAEAGAGGRIRLSVQVERWLLQLPQQQRTALLLRYQEELTPEEIAEAVGAPVATVKSQLQRGLKALRRLTEAAGTWKEMGDVE